MRGHVILAIANRTEHFRAVWTRKRLFAGVNAFVNALVAALREAFVAVLTFVTSYVLMVFHVNVEMVLAEEALICKETH